MGGIPAARSQEGELMPLGSGGTVGNRTDGVTVAVTGRVRLDPASDDLGAALA